MTSPVAAMGATDVPAAAAGRDGGDGGRRGAAERRRRWSRFRPCIDLHDGHVKQIVGGTLTDAGDTLLTNFVAAEDAAYFGRLYREHALEGAHVIKLGPNNDAAARQALAAWPGGLQIGGGIDASNAAEWIQAGAAKVIVTSYLFLDGKFALDRLRALSNAVGRDRLVVDLSCRRVAEGWCVAMNKWQTLTDMRLTQVLLYRSHCAAGTVLQGRTSEFLVHAADVEGLCRGIDQELVQALGEWCTLPCTYAGGAASITDLATVDAITHGKVDLTYGSALDIFGGKTVRFADCVYWNQHGQLPPTKL